MKIGIGSDHAGFRYKARIKEFLTGPGHTVVDLGTNSEESVDYPFFIWIETSFEGGRHVRRIELIDQD